MWEDENVRMHFWGPINHQGDLQTAKNPKIENSQLQFDLWPLKIKQLGVPEGNDQAIKHTFLPIKRLDHGLKHFNRRRVSDYPLEWLTGSAEMIDASRSLARCGWLTILRGWAGEPCKIRVSPAKCGWVGRSDIVCMRMLTYIPSHSTKFPKFDPAIYGWSNHPGSTRSARYTSTMLITYTSVDAGHLGASLSKQ